MERLCAKTLIRTLLFRQTVVLVHQYLGATALWTVRLGAAEVDSSRMRTVDSMAQLAVELECRPQQCSALIPLEERCFRLLLGEPIDAGLDTETAEQLQPHVFHILLSLLRKS